VGCAASVGEGVSAPRVACACRPVQGRRPFTLPLTITLADPRWSGKSVADVCRPSEPATGHPFGAFGTDSPPHHRR
jgi:hypothetical protein